MILPAQEIRKIQPITPFFERSVSEGMTFGLGPAGYDVRIAENINLSPLSFSLASTIEQFTMPDDLIAFVHDKSTWARQGLSLFNTVIEPKWFGTLTLELMNNGHEEIKINAGTPIAQIIFMRLENPTEIPYSGRYQGQEAGPQPARFFKKGEHENVQKVRY